MNAGHPSDRAVLREPEAAVRDRELLELAALAAGLEGDWSRTIGGWDCLILRNQMQPWQPLHDDGDALRLVVKLELSPSCFTSSGQTIVSATNRPFTELEVQQVHDGCPYAATRRAIVRAAAAIGRELRKTASGCSHTAGPDDQSKVDDQEPTTGSSHG